MLFLNKFMISGIFVDFFHSKMLFLEKFIFIASEAFHGSLQEQAWCLEAFWDDT